MLQLFTQWSLQTQKLLKSVQTLDWSPDIIVILVLHKLLQLNISLQLWRWPVMFSFSTKSGDVPKKMCYLIIF